MTVRELSRYYELEKWIEALKKELAEARTRAYNLSNGKDGDDRIGNAVAAMTEKEMHICMAVEVAENARDEIFAYITETVAKDDALVATAMYYRFIAKMPWYKVAMRIGGTSAEACRKMVFRYIGKQN